MAEENAVLESVTKETEDALYSDGEKKPESEVVESTQENTTDGEEKVADSEVKSEEETTEVKEEEKKEIEYKLELSKDSRLDNSAVEEITAFAKENNLSNDMAQAILNKQEETISKIFQNEVQQMDEELEQWRSSVINDKTMGGDNLKKTVEDARRVVERFGSEEFIGILKDTGYGDNPEVVRFLAKIGSVMSDDALILPNAKGAERPVEELFYGKQE